jgi:hypothetical protein
MGQMTDGASRGRWPTGEGVHGGARRTPAGAQAGFSVGAFAISVAFVVLLVTAPEQLDAAWQWLRDLPIVLEIIAWVALLPWMLAYLAWQSSWALWVRVVVVAFLVGGFALSFWRRGR